MSLGQATFDVDSFVVEHKKKVSLEKLRDDLIQYHNILKSSLIELINQDYADFVHLSTHLVGLDKALGKLRDPLETLKSDVDVSDLEWNVLKLKWAVN